MASIVEGNTKTFRVAAAIAANRLVKLNGSGKLAVAGAADTNAIGATVKETFAADELVAVHLLSCSGTIKMTANAAIATDVEVFQTANGRIDDTGTVRAGVALEAATAQGDLIEVMPGGSGGT